MTPAKRYKAQYDALTSQIFDENALKMKELEQLDTPTSECAAGQILLFQDWTAFARQ
jgi:hypothetical protein